LGRLGHQCDAESGQDKRDKHQPVDEMKRIRPVLHQHRGRRRSEGETQCRRDAVDDGRKVWALGWLEVDERSRQRAGRHAGGDALRDSRRKEPSDIRRVQEHQHARDLNHKSRQDHRPPPKSIG
jgi:hypothetical protein